MRAIEKVVGFLVGRRSLACVPMLAPFCSSQLLLDKHGTSLRTTWIVIWRRVSPMTRGGFVTVGQGVLYHVQSRRAHGWRFGVPRPFRLGFPSLTHARAGNLRIHRRPCFLHARSSLERVIALHSRRCRDFLVFDVIEIRLFSVGVFVLCDKHTRPLSGQLMG